jgi:hypothetical protein
MRFALIMAAVFIIATVAVASFLPADREGRRLQSERFVAPQSVSASESAEGIEEWESVPAEDTDEPEDFGAEPDEPEDYSDSEDAASDADQ